VTAAPFVEFAEAGLRLPGGRALLDRLSLAVTRARRWRSSDGSGSGKTTALKLVNALLLPTDGEVRVAGRAGRSHRQTPPEYVNQALDPLSRRLGLRASSWPEP